MSRRGCADVRPLLGGYVHGDVAPLERALVDAHLAHCAACKAVTSALADGIRAARAELPVDEDHLVALVRAAQPPPFHEGVSRRSSPERRPARALAAAGFVGFASAAAAFGFVAVTHDFAPRGGGPAPIATAIAHVDASLASSSSSSSSPSSSPWSERPRVAAAPGRAAGALAVDAVENAESAESADRARPDHVDGGALLVEQPGAPAALPAPVAREARRREPRPVRLASATPRASTSPLGRAGASGAALATQSTPPPEGTLLELIPKLDEAARLGRSGDGEEALARYHALERDPRFEKHVDLIAYERARLQGLVLGDTDLAVRELARLSARATGHVAEEAAVTRCEVERSRDACAAIACLDDVARSGRANAADAKRLRDRWSPRCDSQRK